MLPAFSGRAPPSSEHQHHRRHMPNTQRSMSGTSAKGQTGKAKVPENGIQEAPGFGFGILREARKPPYPKTGSCIVYGQSRV
jgi:hypothetical protein